MNITDLPLETQLLLSSFSFHVKVLNEAECKQKLVDVYVEMTLKDTVYKRAIGQKWGMIDDCNDK